MKILLSPAKKLDFTKEISKINDTNISFVNESRIIMEKLSSYSSRTIQINEFEYEFIFIKQRKK